MRGVDGLGLGSASELGAGPKLAFLPWPSRHGGFRKSTPGRGWSGVLQAGADGRVLVRSGRVLVRSLA